MKMKRFFLNLSIKFKIIFVSYSVIMIVTLILGIFSYTTSDKYILSKTGSSNLSIVRQIDSSLNSLQNDMVDISTYIATNRSIINFLKSDDVISNKSQGNFLINNDLNDSIMNLVVTKKFISLLALYRNGTEFSPYSISTDLSSGLGSFHKIMESPFYRGIQQKKGDISWFFNSKSSTDLLQDNRHAKIALGRLIKDPNDYSNMGLLLLCTNEEMIRSIYASSLQSASEGITITDASGAIISQSGLNFYNSADQKHPFIQKASRSKDGFILDQLAGQDMLIAFSSSNLAGWKIYYSVTTQALTREINAMRTLTFFIMVICLLLSLPFILATSSLITSPLNKLLKSMKKFQLGSFDEKVTINQKDEVGQLGEVYNTMVSNIKELIDQNYVLQIREREAELNALQAQINPHFLYNTLDTIFWRAQACNQKELGKMVYSLSKLFRLSLNRGKSFTQVSGEKELLMHYLLLQKIRFQEKLNYEFDIDESISSFNIPKLILQPFVENAILHGLEGKENGGMVRIRGRLVGERLCFFIEDDGIGMDESSIQKLFDDKSEDPLTHSIRSGGYAIKNVDERLRLNFKGNYSLQFTSHLGVGTTVKIEIPAIQNEEVKEG